MRRGRAAGVPRSLAAEASYPLVERGEGRRDALPGFSALRDAPSAIHSALPAALPAAPPAALAALAAISPHLVSREVRAW